MIRTTARLAAILFTVALSTWVVAFACVTIALKGYEEQLFLTKLK